jgi:hypothetical protein
MAAKQLERSPNLFCSTVADLQQSAAKMITRNEAKRIAANVAKLTGSKSTPSCSGAEFVTPGLA